MAIQNITLDQVQLGPNDVIGSSTLNTIFANLYYYANGNYGQLSLQEPATYALGVPDFTSAEVGTGGIAPGGTAG